MPGPEVEQFIKRLREALPGHGSLDGAVADLRNFLDSLIPGLADQKAAEIEEARACLVQQFEQIEILHTHSLIKKRPQWYFGPRPGDFHWPALEAYLLNEKKWDKDDIKVIDNASNEVVSLLENPRDPSRPQFSCRGLVVGYVQSGKTANMTAVIAKALDAGYDTVIVLAGLTNKLRLQTQLRLFNDLVRRNPLNWQILTPNELNRDFRAPPQGGFLSHSDKAQLAVIKKNVSPLGELRKAIEATFPAVLKQLRVLVIDDECDQASVNSARGELDMTAINQRIREILSMFPAVSYIGYTATPFANVLINPYRLDGQELDDLYPRDFITALPRSDRYFGTEKLFGKLPEDAETPRPEEEGLDMIREIPVEDEELLQPRSGKQRDKFQPNMTPSLSDAILYFLACCAARRARGDGNQHMTMLVHTSAYVVVHERVAALIESWVEVNRGQLADPNSEQGKRVAALWISESGRLPAGITEAPPVSIQEVFQYLPEVLKRLEFPVENGASDYRIDYSGEPKTCIVVGGSILARGLTLEGLMVSYFLRSANQYDTLLQMGRWFGYRPNYEDLPRIWMPNELKLKFRFLATVEQEVRKDIEQYRLRDLTPMDIAVRIRAIPGMAITGATKMRHARPCHLSYWGTHRQTFRFELHDKDLLKRNWAAGAELVSRIDALGLRDPEAERDNRKLWREVPKSSIRRFLESYRIEASHSDLQRELLIPFIDTADSRLNFWNVGIIEPANGTLSEDELGTAGRVKTVRRARLDETGSVADIKALMSKIDVAFDYKTGEPKTGDWDDLKEGRPSVPLLLLYPIDRKSEPKTKNSRFALNAEFDVLGIGIVFPGSVTEGGSYVSVELQTLSADELAEIEAEEADQAEAAGV